VNSWELGAIDLKPRLPEILSRQGLVDLAEQLLVDGQQVLERVQRLGLGARRLGQEQE
jgi:hypothetical protein